MPDSIKLGAMVQEDAKKLLRKHMSKVIERVSADDVEKESTAVAEKVLSSNWFSSARRVSIYVSTRGEISTERLITHCLSNDSKKVFIPKFQRGVKEMQMLQLRSMAEFRGLDSTLWNIRQHPLTEIGDGREPLTSYEEPDADGASGLDLVFVPGLAFTTAGERLGRGMGHYDRFLQHYKEKFGKYPMLVALALRCQMVAAGGIPTQSHDVNMDLVLTS